MGKRGPAPKPTALKLLQGNPGKRPLNTREPRPARIGKMPRAPAWLPPLGKKMWAAVGAELARLGILTVIDLPMFEGMCLHYARWREAEAELERVGAVMERPKVGSSSPHPLVQIAKQRHDVFVRTAREFGLCPSMRVRMEVSAPAREFDPLEEFQLRVVDGRGPRA